MLAARSTKTKATVATLRERLLLLIRETAYFRSAADFVRQVYDYQSRLPESYALNHGVFLGDMKLSEDALSKFLSGDDDRINPHDFKIIVHMLHDKKVYSKENQSQLIAVSYADPLYHAMLDYLHIGDLTLANLKRRAPGLYRAWRPSSSFPGKFWRGVLEISIDADSYAIKANEWYHYAGSERRTPRRITFEGYLFRKSQLYTIVARNDALSSLQTTHLPTVTIFDERITTLAGFVTDMTTARLYTSRIFYERIAIAGEVTDKDRDEAIERSGVITQDNVPDSIMAFFEQRPIPNIHMF